MLYGIRIDIAVGFFTTYVPLTYGVVLGAYSGYIGGWFDAVRDAHPRRRRWRFLSSFSIIVILAILGPGVQNIYISVFLVAWTMYARLARAEMMVERTKDYVLAAEVLGFPRRAASSSATDFPTSSIPRSSSPLSDFVLNILLVSGLSFLGLGVQPPIPEWGAMIAEGRDFLMQAWWISTLPGLAIVFTGTALSLIGDGLAQRLGERHHTLA